MMTSFLGKPFEYWTELSRRLEENPDWPENENLLEELIAANSKLRYYEKMLDRMNKYRAEVDK